MDPFELPDVLPTAIAELTALRGQATDAISDIQTRYEADTDLSSEDVTYLTSLLDAVDALNAAIAEAQTDDEAHRTAVAAAMDRARAVEVVDETPAAAAEVVETVEVVGELVAAGTAGTDQRPVRFTGLGATDIPKEIEEDQPIAPAWVVAGGAPGFEPEEVGTKVGFARVGEAIDSVRKGHGVGRLSGKGVGPKMRQPVVRMSRGLKVVESEHDLVDEINRATREIPGYGKVSTASLTAAGGWCAPSEQIYTFCDVPAASDLISLPEIAINRGGIRWPVEPDLTSIFDSFEFFFTEPELEAVDANGDPTAIKHCVEVPCPDEFEELRLNAVGYCVEAGILQRQGWPESIEWFLRSLTQEHLRAISRRTINDMVAGSGAAKVIPAADHVGATSAVLNSLALMAYNLRISKGYSRSYPIEMVAPSWFFEVLRADLAMGQGVDTKSVSDSWVTQALSVRNISGQFVGDWQTRATGLPGNLDTLSWPGTVDVLLYPAGTWFRHMSNVIELGVMYPKEQVQVNRYTEFFTEDAIAVGKRCDQSILVRVPVCVNGAYGAPVTVSCT